MFLRRLGKRSSPTEPHSDDYVEVAHEGVTHRVLIRRNARARRLTLRVRTATRDVVLTMPARGSAVRARSFIEQHAEWIGARLARVPTVTLFAPGAIIPLRGRNFRIVHAPGRRGPIAVEGATDQEIGTIVIGGDAAFLARRLRDFLEKQARLDLGVAVSRHAATLGKQPRRLTLRDTSTRWGSCSSTGSLSFSWRLILAPPFVLNYLAAHEVAHLAHMDHSTAFWRTVASLDPGYKIAEYWLKANGPELMRFGVREQRRP